MSWSFHISNELKSSSSTYETMAHKRFRVMQDLKQWEDPLSTLPSLVCLSILPGVPDTPSLQQVHTFALKDKKLCTYSNAVIWRRCSRSFRPRCLALHQQPSPGLTS